MLISANQAVALTWRGSNRQRAEQHFSPTSTFKIPNSLIALSLGVAANVDQLIPYTGDPNPFMREWLEPMGIRGAIRVSNVPRYQELARRIGPARMQAAITRLHNSRWRRSPASMTNAARAGVDWWVGWVKRGIS